MVFDLMRGVQGKKKSRFTSSGSGKLFQALPLGVDALEPRLLPAVTLNAAILGLPATDQVNQTTAVTAQANVSGAIGSTYYSWILLKSQAPISSGSGEAFTFTPTTTGTYDVSLSVTDSSGATATADQTLVVTTGGLQQGGFEAPSVGTGSSAYQYNPSGSAWTFTGSAGVAGNNSAFTSSNPAAPAGTQVAFLQWTGSVSQTTTLTAGTYTLNFDAAQRGNSQASSQTFQVQVDGATVGTFKPTSTSYAAYTTNAFTVTAGTHTIAFTALDPSGGDNTAFVDQVQLNTATVAPSSGLQQGGFETPNVGTGTSAYQYGPTGSAWTFTGGAGVAGNNSGFTSGNPSAPEGAQVAFLQMTGSFSQTATLAAGTYTLNFDAAQRGNWQASTQTIQVQVDGATVGTFKPAGTSYAAYTTNAFTVTAGTHTIAFTALDPSGGDNTAFLDQLQLNTATVAPPPSSGLQQGGFEAPSVGTGSSAYQYNPSGSAWTFTGSAGVAGNNSAFTSGNPGAPQGTQVAFLQWTGSVSQTTTLTAGTYTLSFDAAQRGNSQASSQTFQVQVDGTTVGTFKPAGKSYAVYTTNAFTVTAGPHTITFTGLNPNGGDNSAFVDQVQLNTVTVATPLQASITGAPATGQSNAGTAVTLSAQASGGAAGQDSYSWVVMANGQTIASGNTAIFIYTPANPGTDQVALTVTDSSGSTASASQTLHIQDVPPTVTVADPAPFPTGQAISFTASATDISPAVTAAGFSFSWNFGDGTTATGSSAVSHAFSTPGSYTITATATDMYGTSSSGTTVVVVFAPLQASIQGAPSSGQGNAGTPVTLNSQVTGGAAGQDSYSWVATENSQTIASGTTASFTFTPDVGTAQISLTVTDSSGATAKSTQTLKINDVAPTTTVSGLSSAQTGQSLSFTTSATDPSAMDTAAGYTYAWTFGDGGTGTGSIISHVYSTAGSYTVTVTATDINGGASSATTSVLVTAPQPAQIIDVSSSGFTATGPWGGQGGLGYNGGETLFTYGPGDGTAVAQWQASITPGTYEVWATWYGYTTRADNAPYTILDGTTPIATVRVNQNQAPLGVQAGGVAFQELGVFNFQTNTLTVQLTDAADNSIIADSVMFQNAAGASTTPAIAITGAPSSGHSPVGSPVTLGSRVIETSTSDTFQYAWTATKNGQPFATGNAANFTFTPDDNTTYQVKLTVTSPGGATASDTTTVIADGVPPTVTVTGPVSGKADWVTNFSAVGTDISSADAASLTYSWNFGDGSTGAGQNTTHVYANAGTYTATVSVLDKNGATASAITTVNIAGLGPASSYIVTPYDNIPNFGANPTIVSVQSGSWSNPATWSLDRVPTTGDVVSILAGTTVSYDTVSSVALTTVAIQNGGELNFRTDISTQLTVSNLLVMPGGTLQIGTAANPVSSSVTAQIVFPDVPLNLAIDPEQYGNGLIGLGTVTIYGQAKTSFVPLAVAPQAGDTTLTLAQPVNGWQVGDKLDLPDSRQLDTANTGSAYVNEMETVQIAAISANGTVITLAAPLLYAHPGAYNSGNATNLMPDVAERSHNVTIKSANPSGSNRWLCVVHPTGRMWMWNTPRSSDWAERQTTRTITPPSMHKAMSATSGQTRRIGIP